jgi:hypothetical protein
MMDGTDQFRLGVLGVLGVVLLVSSPLVGVVDLTPEARGSGGLGDGTASASVTTLDTDRFRIDRGRFGTGVAYLRLPPVTVTADSVTGQPRLVYRVEVPALEFERTETRLLRETGRVRIGMSARALTRERVNQQSYRATVTVRVQSFEVDRTIYRRNLTVPVTAGAD